MSCFRYHSAIALQWVFVWSRQMQMELISRKEFDSRVTSGELDNLQVKWFTEFGLLNRGDMLTSEQHRCSNEKKKF